VTAITQLHEISKSNAGMRTLPSGWIDIGLIAGAGLEDWPNNFKLLEVSQIHSYVISDNRGIEVCPFPNEI
jgi:hypothetical protein